MNQFQGNYISTIEYRVVKKRERERERMKRMTKLVKRRWNDYKDYRVDDEKARFKIM